MDLSVTFLSGSSLSPSASIHRSLTSLFAILGPYSFPENWYRRSTEYGVAALIAGLAPTYLYAPIVRAFSSFSTRPLHRADVLSISFLFSSQTLSVPCRILLRFPNWDALSTKVR
jgi:hypothetical protein